MGTMLGDFDDDEGGGSLDLGSGTMSSHHPHAGNGGGGSAYDSAGSVDFDDAFADDTPLASLELDVPANSTTALRSKAPTAPAPPMPSSGHAIPDLPIPPPPASSSSPHVSQGPPSSQRYSGQPSGVVPSPVSSQPQVSHAPAPASFGPAPSFSSPPSRPSAAAVIARYPTPPTEVWRTPRYALSVVWRQLEIRTDLESLRRRRSPDVPLYESALRAYDTKTFRTGMIINLAILTVAMILFFMPVIIRFTRTY